MLILGRVAVAALTLALAVPGAGRAEEWQRWGGLVMVLTPDAPGDAPLRAARCMHELRPEHNGVLSYVIEIPADLADGQHPFRLLDGRMSALDGLSDEPANFDVAFYAGMPACTEEPAQEPIRFRGPGDEHGVVPQGATHALITGRNKPYSAVDLEIRLA